MLKQEQVKTPELERMRAVQDESQKIGGFLEWLSEQKINLCEWDGEGLYLTRRKPEQLLAKYFEIDLAKCERERQALLAVIQEDNK